VKNCIKDAFTQQELMDALVIHFGVVTVWDKIFTIAPGTENNYLPSLRNANKRLFLYQAMVLLQDNEAMRHFIVNHTEQNTTVAQWKEAIKTSFGLTYYNDMMVEILAQYVTQYWVHELQEQYMYGSSRLGSVQRNLPLVQQVLNSDSLIYHDYSQDSIRYFYRGQKRYELSNHLGNVLAVITDRKIEYCVSGDLSYYEAQIVSVSDYYPFGMAIKERTWTRAEYRYGFNGMEKDDELKGSGNSLDFGARIYDSRLGRWMSVDPLMKKYPSLSAYSFVANNPVLFIDIDGRDIGLNNKMKKSKQHMAALETVRFSKIFNTYLEHFGSVSSGDINTAKDGILSRHTINLNAKNIGAYGVTTVRIDNGNGKFREYKEGDKISANARFQIDIDIIAYLQHTDFDAGEFAGTFAHEMLVHTAEVIEILIVFENALNAAAGDQDMINEATLILNESMKNWGSRNLVAESPSNRNSSPAHQDMLNGDTLLDEALNEIIEELNNKINGENQSEENKATYEERKNGVQKVKDEDINTD
jgi:RHS repeat-associated protein